MNRSRRIVITLVAVSICAWSGVRAVEADGPGASLIEGSRLRLPGGRTTGLSAAYWRAALTNGGPALRVERLLVIAPDGTVLGRADGDDHRVALPEALAAPLNDGTLHATLVHNHPRNGGLSGEDLAQLGRVGVDRVIAVGDDGSVFEASAGARFDRNTFSVAVYPKALAEVKERVTKAAWFDGLSPAWVTPYLPHLVTGLLDRAGVIKYTMTASLEQRLAFDRHHALADVILKGDVRF